MSPQITRKSRRAYTRTDYNYLLQFYTTKSRSRAACAKALGRTDGSLRYFIGEHPELRKRSKTFN